MYDFNLHVWIKTFSVINRCVPSFLIDVLEKGADMATAVANANASDASGNSYDSSMIGNSLEYKWPSITIHNYYE